MQQRGHSHTGGDFRLWRIILQFDNNGDAWQIIDNNLLYSMRLNLLYYLQFTNPDYKLNNDYLSRFVL
jgi:plasmid maintenance system killer protein